MPNPFLNLMNRKFFTAWFQMSDGLFFTSHHYFGGLPATDKPVLMLCNHISWWDGIWVLLWNRAVFKKDFHVLMLQRELAKRPFLKSLGAIGLEGGRHALATVLALQSICRRPGTLLLIFPEGRIGAAQCGQLKFETALLKRLPLQEVQLVFAYHAIAYGNRFRPRVFHFAEAVDAVPVSALEASYHVFSLACRETVTQEMATLIAAG